MRVFCFRILFALERIFNLQAKWRPLFFLPFSAELKNCFCRRTQDFLHARSTWWIVFTANTFRFDDFLAEWQYSIHLSRPHKTKDELIHFCLKFSKLVTWQSAENFWSLTIQFFFLFCGENRSDRNCSLKLEWSLSYFNLRRAFKLHSLRLICLYPEVIFKFTPQRFCKRNQEILGLPQTKCYRRPKNIACRTGYQRQLNAKILLCRRLAVSLLKKGNCEVVDN